MANPNPNRENLKPPWQPNESGNPEGRKVGSRNVATALKEMLEAYDKKRKGKGEYSVPLSQQLITIAFGKNASEETKLRAVKEIIDRIEGETEQNLKIKGLPDPLAPVKLIIERASNEVQRASDRSDSEPEAADS